MIVDGSWRRGGFVVWVALLCGMLQACSAAAQTVLYTDNFDAGTSAANWNVYHTGDAFSNFAYDYSTRGIPSAPHSTGGSTVGLWFSVNHTSGTVQAISAYPKNQSFSGDVILKFDMWLNYNGPAGGGSGSTELSLAGINQSGTQVHWPNNPACDGFSFGVTGEGGAADDYRAYRGPTMVTGVYAAGSQNHSATLYQNLFVPPAYETRGAPGKHWVEVEISQKNGLVEWRLNGTLISTRTDTTYTSGNLLMGYMDPYASIANPKVDNFVVYDNVRMERPDCNGNGVPDSVDIAGGTSQDCNGNHVPDECDLAAGTAPDCNTNGVPDSCDLGAGTSLDCNGTGKPDECETIAGGDFNADGHVNLTDYASMAACLAGPGSPPSANPPACAAACRDVFDFDADSDVDLKDHAAFQGLFWSGPIPPRPANAMTGTQFKDEVLNMTRADREQRILEEVTGGNIPDFLRTFIPVTVSALIGGQTHNLTYYVMPDYLCIGSDADFFRMPMTPLIAQPIADTFECLLTTRKMTNDIWSAATVKLAPQPISPSPEMITVPVFWQHHLMVEQQRAGQPLGALIAGIKKDVVITPLIATNPNKVAIYGWHYQSGTAIQPLYLGHEITYADYSHGIRLVKQKMLLDGGEVTAAGILADSSHCVLLSDEGVVTSPRY